MQAALSLATTIQPGGRIEIRDAQLPVGQAVDMIVLLRETSDIARRSVIDVLAEAPGQLTFQDAEAVDAYVWEERDSWESLILPLTVIHTVEKIEPYKTFLEPLIFPQF